MATGTWRGSRKLPEGPELCLDSARRLPGMRWCGQQKWCLHRGPQGLRRETPPTIDLGTPHPYFLATLRREQTAFQRSRTTGDCIFNPEAEVLDSLGFYHSQ